MEFEQSLPLCCALAAVGGVLEVGATAVTAVPAVREAEGKEMKPPLRWLALSGNIVLQLTGSIMSHLIATWFGPVSVVVPFFYSSTLLSNMFIFGALLGLEFFTKSMRVGTYVVVVAVILLPVVGPNIQENQDIHELIRHWYAILWSGLLFVTMLVTGFLLSFFDITVSFSQRQRTLILLAARASSIAINLSVSRSFVLGLSHLFFVLFIILKITSGALYTYAIVVQSTAVDQAKFVPLNTTTIIVTNALTGIIIWEDWRTMQSWYGYTCVFVLLGLGCDLLLSTDLPLLNDDNKDFGVHKTATTLLKNRRIERQQGYQTLSDIPITSTFETGGERDDEKVQDSNRLPSHLSRRDAWKRIMHASSVGSSHFMTSTLPDILSTSVTSTLSSAVQASASQAKDVLSKPVQIVEQGISSLSSQGKKFAEKTGAVLHR